MRSEFTGGLLGLIGTRLLCVLVILITLGLGVPWAQCISQRWYTKHTIIDGQRLYFDGNAWQLFGNYIKWFLLTLITFGIYGFWLHIKMQKWLASHTHHSAMTSEK